VFVDVWERRCSVVWSRDMQRLRVLHMPRSRHLAYASGLFATAADSVLSYLQDIVPSSPLSI
jgi:hypothetical protein